MHAAVVQAEVRTGRPPKGWRRFLSDMSEKAFLLTQRLRSLMAEEIAIECYQLVIDEIENKLTEWINFSGLNNEGRRFGDTEAPGSLLKAETKLALRKDLGETRGVSRLRRRQWHQRQPDEPGGNVIALKPSDSSNYQWAWLCNKFGVVLRWTIRDCINQWFNLMYQEEELLTNFPPPMGWRRFLNDLSERAFLLTQKIRSLMAEEINLEAHQTTIDEIEDKLSESRLTKINFSGLNREGRRFGDAGAPGSLLSTEKKLVLRKDLGETKGVSRLRRRQWHRIESVDECPVCFEDSRVRTFVFWDCQHGICRKCTRKWTKDLIPVRCAGR